LEKDTSPFLLEKEKENDFPLPPRSLIQEVDNNNTPSLLPPLLPVNNDLFARLEAFLPQMKEANLDLEKKIEEKGRDEVDLEVISKDETRVIEMDLTLGILQQKKEGDEEEEDEGVPSPSSLLRGQGEGEGKTLVEEVEEKDEEEEMKE